MNTTSIKMLALVMFSSSMALGAESLPLPTPEATPDAALELPITYEATWDTTLDELTTADRLVVVGASVGDEIVLDPGFKVASVEVDDLWITDVKIARRGKGVIVNPTQVGITHVYLADKDGWVLEYELKVEAGVEDAELAAYDVADEVDEDEFVSMPTIAEASDIVEGVEEELFDALEAN